MLASSLIRRGFILMAFGTAGLLAAGGCKSSGGGGSGSGAGGGSGVGGSGGGPVAGPADTHCGTMVQPTSQAACSPDAGTVGAGGGGGSGGGGPEYGVTMYGSEGDDDDCKYHVHWTSTPIAENRNITFTVVATRKTDGTPLTGATPVAEVYLNDMHPGPNTNQEPTESPPGTYQIAPILFDAPGKWTVRFHFFEQCADLLPTSPHGHAAFYVAVP